MHNKFAVGIDVLVVTVGMTCLRQTCSQPHRNDVLLNMQIQWLQPFSAVTHKCLLGINQTAIRQVALT
mgnify:CR=1 FL=1